jgi:CheY-like chemotaxis protein
MIANLIVPDQPLLLIDDSPENLRLEGFLLKSEGLPIRTAETAEQALELLGIGKFSLVLVDIQLPGMDGLELTRQIRNTPDLASLPVVAVTAYSMPGDEERIREAGCDGYISKPINTRLFVTTVRAYLQVKC